MRNIVVTWRIGLIVLLGFLILIGIGMLGMSFAVNTGIPRADALAIRLITVPTLVVCVPLAIYLLVLEGRVAAASQPQEIQPVRLIWGMPPKVRGVVIVQIVVAVICGILGYGFLTGKLGGKRHNTRGFDHFFACSLTYWCLASASAAVLIAKRSRVGLILAWTVFPGIVRTIPGLISKQMKDYLAGRYSDPPLPKNMLSDFRREAQ
jgi:hypothetical protein